MSNINITTIFMDTLSPTLTYKIAIVPMTLPIPFGFNDTTKGTITKATLNTIDTTIPGGAFWACCVIVFDPSQLFLP